jgi:hypothetical protein
LRREGVKDAACIPLRVECYAGYRADERPEAFWLHQRRIAVREILDRWLGEDHAYFKVTGEDGVRYILRHDHRRDQWEMILMEAPTLPSMEGQG